MSESWIKRPQKDPQSYCFLCDGTGYKRTMPYPIPLNEKKLQEYLCNVCIGKGCV